MDEMVYTWTQKGVIRFDLYRRENLTENRLETLLEEPQRRLSGYIAEPEGCFMVANTRHGEVMFGYIDDELASSCVDILVFNARASQQGVWTTWKLPGYTAAAVVEISEAAQVGAVWLADENAREIYAENSTTQNTALTEQYDRSEAATVSSVDGNQVTFSSAPSSWVQTGAVFKDSVGVYHVIVEELTPTVFVVASNSAVATGAGTAYERINGVVETRPIVAKNPAALKAWQYGVATLEELDFLWALNIIHRSSADPNEVTETRVVGPSASRGSQDRSPVRWIVPYQHGHATDLTIRLEIRQACTRWRLGGLVMGYTAMSPRTELGPLPTTPVYPS